MTYRFLEPARNELQAAAQYYETAAPGLGHEFLDEVNRTIQRILDHPRAWVSLSVHHRRCRTRRFPYGIVYSVEGEVIVISAVMHLHRHPELWKNRPGNR